MVDISRDTFADPGVERLVLSLMLKEPDLLIDVSAKLVEKDFLSSSHRTLYSILSSLYNEGVKSFDIMGVVGEAQKRGVMDLIGGPEYVDALMHNPVNRDNFPVYLTKVLDCSTKYRLYQEATFIQENILSNLGHSEDKLPAEELLAQSESRLLTVSMESRQIEDAEDIGVGLREFLEERASNPVSVQGLSTGIPLLDKAINGLMPSSLTVVAARQKGGKSTLMFNMAAHAAYFADVPQPILFIDTELSRQEFQTRVIAHLSGVPERVVTNGLFIDNPQYTENVWRACSIVEQGGLYHKYMPGFSMDSVKNMARKFYARNHIKAFFFDYIKVPEVSSREAMKEHQMLGNIATGLKDLAGQLNIPVVAAAQIKRGESTAPKTRFHDTDVADSDRIGRYCNNLLAIGTKSKKEIEEDGLTCGTHRLQILLARAGTPNYHGIDLHCELPTLTMREADHQSYMVSSFGDQGREDF